MKIKILFLILLGAFTVSCGPPSTETIDNWLINDDIKSINELCIKLVNKKGLRYQWSKKWQTQSDLFIQNIFKNGSKEAFISTMNYVVDDGRLQDIALAHKEILENRLKEIPIDFFIELEDDDIKKTGIFSDLIKLLIEYYRGNYFSIEENEDDLIKNITNDIAIGDHNKWNKLVFSLISEYSSFDFYESLLLIIWNKVKEPNYETMKNYEFSNAIAGDIQSIKNISEKNFPGFISKTNDFLILMNNFLEIEKQFKENAEKATKLLKQQYSYHKNPPKGFGPLGIAALLRENKRETNKLIYEQKLRAEKRFTLAKQLWRYFNDL